MKRNLIALALVFLSGNAPFASTQVPPGQPQPIRSASLVVSEYGTLLGVLNADGIRVATFTDDGFLVSYELKGSTETVQAIGETHSGLRPGQVNLAGNYASVTLTTDDGALEITNSFTLNEQTSMLTIRRRLRNRSSQRLNLLTTKQYLDPKLMRATCSTNPTLLEQEVNRGVTANGRENNGALLERPPHDPPCLTVICMENSLRNRPFLDAQEIGDCTRISLEWGRHKIFAPLSRAHTRADEVRAMHFIVRVSAN